MMAPRTWNRMKEVCRDLGRSPRRTMGLLRWIFLPALGPAKERRLLGIYDLGAQPFSIGDVLLFQEATLVLRERHGLGAVDFALLCDPQRPASPDPQLALIRRENFMGHLAALLPAAQVNPHLGSLFLFDSHLSLERYVADNVDRYYVWPSAWQFGRREYLTLEIFNRILLEFYRERGRLPPLGCRPPLVDWAWSFFRRHVAPCVPVVVQVRRNPFVCPDRNLDMDCWLEFFRHCSTRYPVKFVAICAGHEVDARLREHDNVIIAKDYHTALEQDLALIHTGALNMGASSGPNIMAMFGPTPYLFVRLQQWKAYEGTSLDGRLFRHSFATPLQNFLLGNETLDLLTGEFAKMWKTVDVDAWRSRYAEIPEDRDVLLSWMR